MVRWKFHTLLYGFRHVVADEEGRVICTNVSIDKGPLMAKAPAMLDALRAIAQKAPAGSEERRIAETVIHELGEEYRALEAGQEAEARDTPPANLYVTPGL